MRVRVTLHEYNKMDYGLYEGSIALKIVLNPVYCCFCTLFRIALTLRSANASYCQ